MLLVFLLFLSPTVLAQTCISDLDCPSGSHCVQATPAGYRTCTSNSVGKGAQPSPVIECTAPVDCAPHQICVFAPNGDRLCQYTLNAACGSDRDCSSNEACKRQNDGQSRCEIVSGGNLPGRPGGLEAPCSRDADCESNLRCVDFYGSLQCRYTTGGNIQASIGCQSAADCLQGQICSYRASIDAMICMWQGEATTMSVIPTGPGPVVGGNVGSSQYVGRDQYQYAYATPRNTIAEFDNVQMNSDQNSQSFAKTFKQENATFVLSPPNSTIIPTYTVVEPHVELSKSEEPKLLSNGSNLYMTKPNPYIIDPAAMPCIYDYQCRMGEACTGNVFTVDANFTVCQYDLMKENRMCLYHSDCLQGQRCRKNATGTYVCISSADATIGNITCAFDFECSGGEKCTKDPTASNPNAFLCKPSPFPNPRRNQRCANNADCPFQQVCRNVAEVKMCVDYGSPAAQIGKFDIQKKLVQFVHDLLFARI